MLLTCHFFNGTLGRKALDEEGRPMELNTEAVEYAFSPMVEARKCVRSKLIEIVEQNDAHTLKDLLNGVGLPALSSDVEPWELVLGALRTSKDPNDPLLEKVYDLGTALTKTVTFSDSEYWLRENIRTVLSGIRFTQCPVVMSDPHKKLR